MFSISLFLFLSATTRPTLVSHWCITSSCSQVCHINVLAQHITQNSDCARYITKPLHCCVTVQHALTFVELFSSCGRVTVCVGNDWHGEHCTIGKFFTQITLCVGSTGTQCDGVLVIDFVPESDLVALGHANLMSAMLSSHSTQCRHSQLSKSRSPPLAMMFQKRRAVAGLLNTGCSSD